VPAMSGSELKRRLEHTDLDKRLVVSPLLEPDEQLRGDQASIDVRSGFEFALVAPSSHAAIDEFAPKALEEGGLRLDPLYRKMYVPFRKYIVIHPHQFILGMTLEYIRLPRDLLAYVIGRSTWGRLGLIVATAIGVHPGFAGCLILELRNLGETPLALYPGQAIAQFFFHKVRKGELAEGEMGQYSGVVDLVPKRASSARTHKTLASLIRGATREGT
jgi:dCTP deaminase